jgi:hypothetical protein
VPLFGLGFKRPTRTRYSSIYLNLALNVPPCIYKPINTRYPKTSISGIRIVLNHYCIPVALVLPY